MTFAIGRYPSFLEVDIMTVTAVTPGIAGHFSFRYFFFLEALSINLTVEYALRGENSPTYCLTPPHSDEGTHPVIIDLVVSGGKADAGIAVCIL